MEPSKDLAGILDRYLISVLFISSLEKLDGSRGIFTVTHGKIRIIADSQKTFSQIHQLER